MSKDKKKDIAEVIWVDSKLLNDGWEFSCNIQGYAPVNIKTVGYVLKKNSEYISLTMGMNDSKKGDGENTQILPTISIPMSCIKKIRWVR